jgi:hypothetical protein
MSNSQPHGRERSRIARVSTPLFVLLCLATSLLAAGLLFVATAITIALIDAALKIGTQPYEVPLLLLSIAAGFLAPIPWLRKKRRRLRTPAAAMPPPLDAAIAEYARTKAEPRDHTPIGTRSTPNEPGREDQRVSAGEATAATRLNLSDFEKWMDKPPSARRLVIGGIVTAAFVAVVVFVYLNGNDGPTPSDLGQCDSSWTISHLKQIRIKPVMGNEIEILDVTKIRELSRKKRALFCQGLGYLSIGKQEIYWNIEFIEPQKDGRWYLEVSLDPQF